MVKVKIQTFVCLSGGHFQTMQCLVGSVVDDGVRDCGRVVANVLAHSMCQMQMRV